MPLTRHFYDSEEVLSALYYTSSRRDTKETEFWCNELLCSGYSSEAISILFESWLWQRGPFYLRWLLDSTRLASSHVTEEMIMASAVQLSSFGEWDQSLWHILTDPVQDPGQIDRVTCKTPPFLPADANEDTVYLYRALYQGKARSAWIMSQRLSGIWTILKEYGSHVSPYYSECFAILERYEDLLGYRTDLYDTAVLCCAVLMLCLSDAKRESSFRIRPPTSLSLLLPIGTLPIGTLPIGTLPIGTKAARLYPIPSMALYGTPRGQRLSSNYDVSGLHDVEKGIKGCPFWDDVLRQFQRNGKWVSDDAMEAYYEQYFPDDIPDEWSREEKLKSHGQGLLSPGESMTLQRYAKIHFTKPARFALASPKRKPILETIAVCHPTAAIRGITTDASNTEINRRPLIRKYVI